MSQKFNEPIRLVHTDTSTSIDTNTQGNFDEAESSAVMTMELPSSESLYQPASRKREPKAVDSSLMANNLSLVDETSTALVTDIRPNRDFADTTILTSERPRSQGGSSNYSSIVQASESLVMKPKVPVFSKASMSYDGNDLANFTRSTNISSLNRNKDPPNLNLKVGKIRSRDISTQEARHQLNQCPQRFSSFKRDQSIILDALVESYSYISIPRSRQISLSMGSQATVFRTRSSSHQSQNRIRRRQKQSIGFAHAGAQSETCPSFSSLERRKAIRFKEGGKMYRLRLFLRKLAAKLRRKFGSFPQFVSRSKKATSKAQTASQRPFIERQVSRKKKNSASRTILQISAPLANSSLKSTGGSGASEVQSLNDALKMRAGLGGVPDDKFFGYPSESSGSTAEISRYLLDKKNISIKPLEQSEASMASSVPPPPPPHTNDSFKGIHSESVENEHLRVEWKRYLSNVLAQRIRLRQEVQLYQLILAKQRIPSILNNVPYVIEKSHSEPALANDNTKSTRRWSQSVAEFESQRASIVLGKFSCAESESEYSMSNVAPRAHIAPSESTSNYTILKEQLIEESPMENDDVSSLEEIEESPMENGDASSVEQIEQIEQIQKILNRRSILGEMLDYDSDDLVSQTSSKYSTDSSEDSRRITKSISDSSVSLPLAKRYGTVRRRHTDKSYGTSKGSSSHYSGGTKKSISRSPKFDNLQEI